MAIIQDRKSCERARMARDARFDGLFFIAVKTTNIYCRPICPAGPPLEKNVEYHDTAISAAQAGYRPCMRCRPDSAPQSCAWRGTQTTFQRALELIQQGALEEGSIDNLASRLGISDRYLRELFETNLGTSPKKYAIYQQCLFAKQLLHETLIPITEIAFASGFKSVRRFNEAMQQQLNLSPTQIRKTENADTGNLELKLYYRPPFAWEHSLEFLARRVIPGIEWIEAGAYFRTIEYGETKGYMRIGNNSAENYLTLTLHLNDYRQLNRITQRVRSVFDVDAPVEAIDSQLQGHLRPSLNYLPGLRIPGIWSTFEAGVRAILGQQVSVTQAMNLVSLFVEELGEDCRWTHLVNQKFFPKPARVAASSLDFFRMPQSRKDTIRRLAEHFMHHPDPSDVDKWLDIKGIGPWTVNYVKIRASKDPNIWLAGDAGINNALKLIDNELDIDAAKPWMSYLTFQLWNQL